MRLIIACCMLSVACGSRNNDVRVCDGSLMLSSCHSPVRWVSGQERSILLACSVEPWRMQWVQRLQWTFTSPKAS